MAVIIKLVFVMLKSYIRIIVYLQNCILIIYVWSTIIFFSLGHMTNIYLFNYNSPTKLHIHQLQYFRITQYIANIYKVLIMKFGANAWCVSTQTSIRWGPNRRCARGGLA